MFVQKESFLRSLLPRLWCAGCGKESTVAQSVANLTKETPRAGPRALSRVVKLATPGAGIWVDWYGRVWNTEQRIWMLAGPYFRDLMM